MSSRLLSNVTCVSVGGRGILIEGPPGIGKSSLALALIDRGATLVGDDGVALERRGKTAWALPPPNIAGRLEIRGVGIVTLPADASPLALAIALGGQGERLPRPAIREIEGVGLPLLQFEMSDGLTAIRAEWALRMHGLPGAVPETHLVTRN